MIFKECHSEIFRNIQFLLQATSSLWHFIIAEETMFFVKFGCLLASLCKNSRMDFNETWWENEQFSFGVAKEADQGTLI